MRLCHKRNIAFLVLILAVAVVMCGCAKYSLIKEETMPRPTLEQEAVRVYVKPFIDIRPKEEKEGLTEETKRMLSFASSDEHFEEVISDAITVRMVNRLQASGFRSIISPYYHRRGKIEDLPFEGYILTGQIKHFQVVMQLPGVTFVPYLGTAASVVSKDEFNIAVSIEVILKDAQTNEILLNQAFDVSKDLNLPVGLFSLARIGRGRSHRFRLLDESLNDVLNQITQEIDIVTQSKTASKF